MLEKFQVGYVRALAKVGLPLEKVFLEKVGPAIAVEAEMLWQEERARIDQLMQRSLDTFPLPAAVI